ncbi:MAG: hypothetical protein QXL82_01895 [Candidatus Aenigmatarchaeota archaeon]
MKGISPLIATALLLVITVGVSFGLWLYINSYISSQTAKIPKICHANFDVSGNFNKTHLLTKIIYLAGPELNNLTLNALCYSNQITESIQLLDEIKPGMFVFKAIDFSCSNKNEIEITLSAICENQMTIVYKCDRGLCNILEE